MPPDNTDIREFVLMEDKQQFKMTETLTISEILNIECVRAIHSTVLAQNVGIHAKSRSSPSSERQKNKQKKNLKIPQKPPQNKQTRKPLLSEVS